MTYPGGGTYPGALTFPGLGGGPGPGPDLSGNPTGFDESGYWAGVDNTRPDVLKWLAVSLLSGQIICDLPGITSADPIRRTLGKYESITANLTVTDKTSPSWREATRPGASALVAYRGQPGSEVVYWGGIVLHRTRAMGTNTAVLTLVTPECYLDRRYTGAYTTDPAITGAKRDQNVVVSDLVTDFVRSNSGLPITVTTVSNGLPVPTVYAVYNDYDDKTVYSNIGTLNAAVNGPEFTAHWVWNQAAATISPVLYVGNRIGFAVPAGLAPRATFDVANLISGALDEDYSTGKGANVVTATSSGQGLARPQATSPVGTPNYNGRPRMEYRYQPSTSIADPLTLQQHSDRGLTLIGDGTNTVTLKANAQSRPLFGVDWALGDDIGYVLTGPLFPGDFAGVGRCIGYEVTDSYTSPVLYVGTII